MILIAHIFDQNGNVRERFILSEIAMQWTKEHYPDL